MLDLNLMNMRFTRGVKLFASNSAREIKSGVALKINVFGYLQLNLISIKNAIALRFLNTVSRMHPSQ